MSSQNSCKRKNYDFSDSDDEPDKPKRVKQLESDYEDMYTSEMTVSDFFVTNDNSTFSTPSLTNLNNKIPEYWKRNVPKTLNPDIDCVTFQQIEIDSFLEKPNTDLTSAGTDPETAPVLRIFGITIEGHSVVAYIHGFMPYFYIIAPPISPQNELIVCESLKEEINKSLSDEKDSKKFHKYVLSVIVEEKQSLYGYSDHTSKFLKITLSSPTLIAPVRRLLETGDFSFNEYPATSYETFESNIEFEVRFMVDMCLVGFGWARARAGTYKLLQKQNSHCQIELSMKWNDLECFAPEGEWQCIAPIRILSFDIECAGRKGIFPEPDVDPVIQISNVMQIQGEKDSCFKVIFALHETASIMGAEIFCYENEEDLLAEWSLFIVLVDPDVFTGYNIINFDLPYLINRSLKLKILRFSMLGRIKNITSIIKETTFHSRAYGKRENKSINIIGRVQFDVYQVILRDHKLRSYTLNSVSYHFLGQQKEDVHHSIITELFNGDKATRRRLALYCLKDAVLPLRLIDKLMCLINYIEMSKVTGVPLSYLCTRGQQIKVVSQLLRKAKERNLIMPSRKIIPGEEFEGATVIEPIRGYYAKPIAVLDFSSLYPSIMMAHNLCYTTLIQSNQKNIIQNYTKTPSGDLFVNRSYKKGLLPQILEDIIEARKKVKSDLKNETDPFKKKVLDGRQLALKLSANSVYGFTGATVGKLPCLAISRSVTAYGREMIEKSKSIIERNYTIANGYPNDSLVIYGDTDSVMISFNIDTVEEAIDYGRAAAKLVSKEFPHPIKLEFEKVYYPYLLINKKRYAGLFYTNCNRYDKMDCKGIETVRRDNCPLVANLINASLQKILISRDPQAAFEFVKQNIADLVCNRIDISQLVISKELTKSDKDYSAKQAHRELANRMKIRDPGSAPSLGDRVPYVIICGFKGQPLYERAEEPLYVLDNNIEIDFTYYLEQQLSNPLTRIFTPIIGEFRVKNEMLKGKHTMARTRVTPSIGGLTKFTEKREKCLGCKTTLNCEEAVCRECLPNISEFYQREIAQYRTLEENFACLWTECQHCQGSIHEEVICSNNDCPIFYMRIKVRKDLQEHYKLLNRYDIQVECDW